MAAKAKIKKIFRVFLKSIFWLVAGLAGLVLLVILALQLPTVQRFIAGQAASYLSNTIGTKVSIDKISLLFPKTIVIKELYMEGQKADTLIYSRRFYVDVDLFALMDNTIKINTIALENTTAHVYRQIPDSTFNFDYIIDAFVNGDTITTPEDTVAATKWAFLLHNLELHNIAFTFKDEVGQSNLSMSLNYFNLDVADMNLNQSHYILDLLEVEGLHVSYASSLAAVAKEEEEEESEAQAPLVKINRARFQNINMDYADAASGQELKLLLGNLGMDAATLDVAAQWADIEGIFLENTTVTFATSSATASGDTVAEKTDVADEVDEAGWKFNLNNIRLDNIGLNYSNKSEPQMEKGIDFNHLAISDFSLHASNIYFSDNYIQTNLERLSFKEKSGFRIDEFSTNATIDERRARLANFNLVTGASRISNHFEISYPSLDKIGKNLAEHTVHIDLDGTSIGIRDLLYLSPELAKNQALVAFVDRNIRVGGRIKGPVSDLLISQLRLNFAETTNLLVNGGIKGLPDAENAIFRFDTIKLATTRQDIKALVPDTLLPEGITIPQQINLAAFFRGSLKDFSGKADLTTTSGNVFADIVMKPGPDTLPAFTAGLRVENLNLGQILQQPETLGEFGLEAQISGIGSTVETIQADIAAVVTKAQYNKYEYNNLTIDGLYMHQHFNGTIKMKDDNLDFEFAGLFDLREELPDVNASFKLRGVNLQALNFTQEDIRIQGIVNVDIHGKDIDNFDGDLGIRNVIVIKNGETYKIDSLLFASVRSDLQKSITLESDFLSAHIRGTINPSDLGEVIQSYISNYFNLNEGEVARASKDTLKPQVFEFDLNIINPVIISELLVPGLEELSPVSIRGSFNSITQSFNFNMGMPLLVYEGLSVDSMFLDIFSTEDALQFRLNIAEVSNPAITLPNLAFTGNIANNFLNSTLTITEEDGRVRFGMPLNAQSLQDTLLLTFYPGDFILNYQSWNIPENNYLLLLDNGFIVHNLVLEREGQFLSANTRGNSPTDPLELAFNRFNIGNFSSIIEGEGDTLFRGILDGNVVFRDLQTNPVFTSALDITNFSYQNDTLGNINLQASNTQRDIYNLKASITGFGNQVDVGGTYTQESGVMDFNANIKNFELSSIEAFVEEYFSTLSGQLKGNLKITGTAENPDILGSLNFINSGFNLVALNSYFTMPNERIIFDRKGIRFPALTLKDTLNNEAVVNGYIITDDYRQMVFDLNVRANNFLAMNRAEEELDLYYGTIIIDSDIRIRGDLAQPVVDARIGLLRGSSLTLVIPETQVAMVEKEGIVEFIALDDGKLSPIMDANGHPQDTLKAEMRGVELRANVTIDDATRFRIIIDESTGDFIEVQGGATVSFGIDPSGAMSLTGTYEIKDGKYQLSFYNLVKREFDIRPGSTITWTGDPMNADVDISAIYTVRTSPAELMEGQGLDEQQRRAMRNQLPFQVFLNMRGELLRPEIDFNIELPDDRRGAMDGTVNARLQLLNEQENELNKQVFALLILGRFIAEDPLQASGGGGITATARSSASRLLTQQLNQLAGKYIRGVDLTFDVESYEEFGAGEAEGRTELQVGLSRAFLDERLRVEVGGRVDLEGERRRQQRNVSDIAGDVAVEYLLSEDGMYRLRGFRRNEFQMLLDGDVIETGLSFIYTRNFNKIRELFKRQNGNGEKRMLPTLEEGLLPEEIKVIEEEGEPQQIIEERLESTDEVEE
jgi:translocation and assembly module TamB